MKNIYEKETREHINDPIVKKYLKQINLNKIYWIVGSSVGLLITILLATLGAIWKWDNTKYIIAILVPALLTTIGIVMTVVIFLGNKVAVKMYKTDKITFYSGPGTNCLYLNDKLIAKGSNERKLTGTLTDGSIIKIVLKTISFRIDVLPPPTSIPTEPNNQPKPQA